MLSCSTDPQGFRERWKVVLLIHTIRQIWWSLLETKPTDTLSGQNRQGQIVLGEESQGGSFSKSFFLFFFFCGEVETVQSEKQHIVLTESFLFISIAVEKGDFDSLFSFFSFIFPEAD